MPVISSERWRTNFCRLSIARCSRPCSPAQFHSRLMLKRKLQYLGLVNLQCRDTAKRHRRPVTKRRLRVTAKHPRPDMVKARGTTITAGSIASDLRIGNTNSVSAWSMPPTLKIANECSIAFTKSMKNVGSSVGAIEMTSSLSKPTASPSCLRGGPGRVITRGNGLQQRNAHERHSLRDEHPDPGGAHYDWVRPFNASNGEGRSAVVLRRDGRWDGSGASWVVRGRMAALNTSCRSRADPRRGLRCSVAGRLAEPVPCIEPHSRARKSPPNPNIIIIGVGGFFGSTLGLRRGVPRPLPRRTPLVAAARRSAATRVRYSGCLGRRSRSLLPWDGEAAVL